MSKSAETKPTRDQTFWKVLDAALELDFKKGHLKWTMSELSRKSGITRSLVYYHFGRSKSGILTEAVRVIGIEIVGISKERMELWNAGDWPASVRQARLVADKSPYLINFYLIHRDRPTEIGEGIRELEKQLNAKLAKFFPQLEPAERSALYALFFGLTFFPLADAASIDAAVKSLKSLLKKT
ncbi:MAG: TetR/AcrR family transcriptional regulator [Bdellovibrionota bacterium]